MVAGGVRATQKPESAARKPRPETPDSAERRGRRSALGRYWKRVALAIEQGLGPGGWNGCPVAVKNSGAPSDV